MNERSDRGHRKERIGIVVSDKMQKTIVVKVDSLAKHPEYKRIIHRSKKFKVHDEEKKAKIGDRVKIVETRPISKDKRWRLVEVLK
ncbi:MAG: 30S ribosomal protein S17 [Candidatus Omnitrophota bacterium]|nr:30S ribosomal protein S17 [Candidatus Omnitrophota bacterium]